MRLRVQPLRGFRFIIEILSRETAAVILKSAMLDEILRFAENGDHGVLRTAAQKKTAERLGHTTSALPP